MEKCRQALTELNQWSLKNKRTSKLTDGQCAKAAKKEPVDKFSPQQLKGTWASLNDITLKNDFKKINDCNGNKIKITKFYLLKEILKPDAKKSLSIYFKEVWPGN